MAEAGSLGLSRLVGLAIYIFDNPGVRVSEAARQFGRSTKQLRRDVSVLIEAGFDDLLPGRMLELDLDGYFDHGTLSLHSPLGLERGATITQADLALLVYGLHAIAPSLGQGEASVIPSAVAKASALAGLEGSDSFPFLETIDRAATGDHLGVLRIAAQMGTSVQFNYVNGAGVHSVRKVTPMALTLVRDGWLLDAVCWDSRQRRTFRLDRMSAIRTISEPDGGAADHGPAQCDDNVGIPCKLVLDASGAWLTHETNAVSVRTTPDGIEADYVVWDSDWIRTETLLMAKHVLGSEPSSVRSDAGSFARNALANWDLMEARLHGKVTDQ